MITYVHSLGPASDLGKKFEAKQITATHLKRASIDSKVQIYLDRLSETMPLCKFSKSVTLEHSKRY